MSKVESGQIVIFSEPIQFLNGHSEIGRAHV